MMSSLVFKTLALEDVVSALDFSSSNVWSFIKLFAVLFVGIMLGAYTRRDTEEKKKDIKKMFELFPRLEERKNQIAGTLSGGEQQMLAICRALMSRPKLLLLDEPSMGLSPILVKEVFDIIKKIHDTGTTILLVEQNAEKALSICDKAYVLETGSITLSGTGSELKNNDMVKKAYLGG